MRFKKVVIAALALGVLPLAGAFARGAGGFTWGEQYFDQGLSNINLGTSYNGVYGYSTTYGRQTGRDAHLLRGTAGSGPGLPRAGHHPERDLYARDGHEYRLGIVKEVRRVPGPAPFKACTPSR